MAFCINLGLDPDLPLMVWTDLVLLYPQDYVMNRKSRKVRATENQVQYLVTRAIKDVRKSLKQQKAEDYLAFRSLVVRRLCDHYGFVLLPSARRTIIAEEVTDVVSRATPAVHASIPPATPRLEKIREGGHPEADRK